jgi:hypothetical protein
MKALGWLYFIFVQIVAFVCMVVGWFLLAPLAARGQWVYTESIHWPTRQIAVWKWRWVDVIWGNDEDGVIGAPFYAQQVKNVYLRAYLWSAWRNSANNLRFVFRWKNTGPFYKWVSKNGKWYFQAGWYADNGFPVLSAGRT